MTERVTILGAGAWGMAVARLLDLKGAEVTLWAYEKDEFASLSRFRTNPTRLKGVTLAPSIDVTNDPSRAVLDCTWLVLAVPSQYLRPVLVRIRGQMRNEVRIVNLAKGIETGTLLRMSEVITSELGISRNEIVTLSGPSHAEEVVLDMPTTVVAAGASEAAVSGTQELFSGSGFRVYSSSDLIGVELGGALKNIVALAAGIIDGLGFGDNTKGALITRGLAEITRLGIALGAQAETFAGLSGIGDLVATCTSRHSRNRYVGQRIGQGESLQEILGGMTTVAEGVETTRSGYELAKLHHVEMPITTQVYHVLFGERPPSEAVAELMGRTLKAEIW